MFVILLEIFLPSQPTVIPPEASVDPAGATDVVQDQAARVTVSPEEGSALQNTVIRPVAGTQIAFPYRARERRIDDSFRLILN